MEHSIATETELAPVPGSAVDARRFVRQTLTEWHAEPELIDRAQLVASELVTNAVLHAGHAGGPSLQVALGPDAVKLSVHDRSHEMPTYKHFTHDAVVGRGLGVVARAARRWGVDPDAVGKTVWAELDRHSSDVEPHASEPILGTVFPTEPEAPITGEQALVRFVDVPVDLYLALEQHHDAILREFELLSIQLSLGTRTPSAMPPSLKRVAEKARHYLRFSNRALRSRVQQASTEGKETVELDAVCTPATLESAREWTELMDEADELARQGLLLVSPARPQVVQLRRWFFDELEAQLGGQREPHPPPAQRA